MLDGESEAISIACASEVEITVAPGMQLGASAQGLSGAEVSATLSGVMDQNDSGLVATLQSAQVVEQRSDVSGDVLVNAVQAHEGVEQEQGWAQSTDGIVEPVAIELEVDTQRGGSDDL